MDNSTHSLTGGLAEGHTTATLSALPAAREDRSASTSASACWRLGAWVVDWVKGDEEESKSNTWENVAECSKLGDRHSRTRTSTEPRSFSLLSTNSRGGVLLYRGTSLPSHTAAHQPTYSPAVSRRQFSVHLAARALPSAMYTRAFTRCDEACAPECCVIFLGIEDTYTIGVHRVTIQTELFPHLPNEEDEVRVPSRLPSLLPSGPSSS